MTLKPLSAANMEMVRHWRHDIGNTLRTPYMLTEEMQRDYYENTICARNSTTRYWGLWTGKSWADVEAYAKAHNLVFMRGEGTHSGEDTFIGYGGIENIEWENGTGEISLLISPDERGKGYGRQAVMLFLEQAFEHMNLHTVHGECYQCGPYLFWEKMLAEWGGPTHQIWLPCRKYWKGRYYDSLYFTFWGPHEKEAA